MPKKGYKLVKSLFGKYEEIPEEWEKYEIGELVQSIKSGVSRLLSPTDIGYLVFTSGNIQNNLFEPSDKKYWYKVDDKGVNLKEYILDEGDILLNFINSIEQIGKSCIFKKQNREWIYSTNLFRIKTNPSKITHIYFNYLLNSELIQKQFRGITQPAVNQASFSKHFFEKIHVFLPVISKQQKISSILSNVDNLIDSYGKTIEQTKKLKMGLMQRFLTKGIGHKKFKKVKWLFGKEMEIPEEWEIKPLKITHIRVIDGDRGNEYPKEFDFLESGYCLFLSTKNVTKNGFEFTECSFITKDKDEKLRKGKLSRNDIVITTRGTIGNIAFFDDSVQHEQIRINSGMALLRNNDKSIVPKFLYLFLKSNLIEIQLQSIKYGSAQPQLTISTINSLKINIPPISEQQKIASILSSVNEKISEIESKKFHLEKLKKGLMQKLLTGQIKVEI